MNQIYFENQFFETDKMLKEYIRRVICRRLLIGCYVIAILSLLFGAFTVYIRGNVAFMVFAFLISIAEIIFMPVYAFSVVKKSNEKLHNGKKVETKTVFCDIIIVDEGNFHLEIQYSQLHCVYELKDTFAIMLDKRTGIIIAKDGFTIGSQEEFKKFIGKHCKVIKRMQYS